MMAAKARYCLPLIIDDTTLYIGGLAQEGLGFEVEACRQPLHHLSSFRKEGELELLEDDGDALADRLCNPTILYQNGEQSITCLDLLGEVKGDDGVARLVALEGDRLEILTIQANMSTNRVILQRLPCGTLDLQGSGDAIPSPISLANELQLLLDARGLKGADQERPLSLFALKAADPNFILSTLYMSREIDSALSHTACGTNAQLTNRGPLGADQLKGEASICQGAVQILSFEIPGFDPDGLAGSIERLIDLDVDPL